MTLLFISHHSFFVNEVVALLPYPIICRNKWETKGEGETETDRETVSYNSILTCKVTRFSSKLQELSHNTKPVIVTLMVILYSQQYCHWPESLVDFPAE